MIFPVPPPKPLIHPTVEQVERRKLDILMWDLEHRQQQEWIYAFNAAKRSRTAAHAVLTGSAFVACMAFAAFGYPVAAALSLAAVVVTGAATARASASVPVLPEIGNRPDPLSVVEYSKWENDYLISRQHPQPFKVECVCPGCGSLGVHLMDESATKVPWGKITRQCLTCQREWVQG